MPAAPRAADEAEQSPEERARAVLGLGRYSKQNRGKNLPKKRGSGLSGDVCERFPEIRRGMLDGYQGNRRPPDYETWDRERQVLYEQMRQAGVMARVRGIKFSWPPDVLLPAEIVEADRKDLLDAD